MRICDSHCHLQDHKFSGDLQEVINNALNVGVECFIVPGWDIQSSKKAIKLSIVYEFIYPAGGIHPHDAKNYNRYEEDAIKEFLKEKKIVAIGEIGLDYYRDLSPRDVQRDVFKRQLKLAEQYNIPVIIHSRESMEDAISIVSAYNVTGVFHAFDGTIEQADRIIKMGYKIGIGGIATYKNSKINMAIKEVPLEGIIVETDSPYLSPHPQRGRRNEPAYIIYTLKWIAEVKSLSIDEVAEITYNNALSLFKI